MITHRSVREAQLIMCRSGRLVPEGELITHLAAARAEAAGLSL
ncbi:hypothetical protein ACFW0V_06295 [Micromonospora parva]